MKIEVYTIKEWIEAKEVRVVIELLMWYCKENVKAFFASGGANYLINLRGFYILVAEPESEDKSDFYTMAKETAKFRAKNNWQAYSWLSKIPYHDGKRYQLVKKTKRKGGKIGMI